MAEAGMNSRMCYTAVVLGNHAVEHVDTQYSMEASHGLIHGVWNGEEEGRSLSLCEDLVADA